MVRRSVKTVPPAHGGSPGMIPASDHDVSTAPSWILASAASIAARIPSLSFGMSRTASSLRQTTRLRRPSASGRAMPECSGVTRWIHSELRRGVSTGTGMISLRLSPSAFAISRMIAS